MYMTIARIAQSFDMELYETTEEALDVYHARLTGYPRTGTSEVKARILRKRYIGEGHTHL